MSDRKWYRLRLSLYLTDDQAKVVNTKWAEAFMRTVHDILPTPDPTIYVDAVELEEE